MPQKYGNEKKKHHESQMFNYLDILRQRKHRELKKYRKETETERNATKGVCIKKGNSSILLFEIHKSIEKKQIRVMNMKKKK